MSQRTESGQTVLFTGFEPFGGASVNPSWEAVRHLPDQIDDYACHTLQLPVAYGACWQTLRPTLETLRPKLVISVGVAEGRRKLTPELVAVNYRAARIPDNAGKRFTGEKIDPEGHDAHMTALPVQAILASLQAADIDAELSLSAGAFVCNDLYYHLLAHQTEYGYLGLFVHVPSMETLAAERAAAGLKMCASAAIRYLHKEARA